MNYYERTARRMHVKNTLAHGELKGLVGLTSKSQNCFSLKGFPIFLRLKVQWNLLRQSHTPFQFLRNKVLNQRF